MADACRVVQHRSATCGIALWIGFVTTIYAKHGRVLQGGSVADDWREQLVDAFYVMFYANEHDPVHVHGKSQVVSSP